MMPRRPLASVCVDLTELVPKSGQFKMVCVHKEGISFVLLIAMFVIQKSQCLWNEIKDHQELKQIDFKNDKIKVYEQFEFQASERLHKVPSVAPKSFQDVFSGVPMVLVKKSNVLEVLQKATARPMSEVFETGSYHPPLHSSITKPKSRTKSVNAVKAMLASYDPRKTRNKGRGRLFVPKQVAIKVESKSKPIVPKSMAHLKTPFVTPLPPEVKLEGPTPTPGAPISSKPDQLEERSFSYLPPVERTAKPDYDEDTITHTYRTSTPNSYVSVTLGKSDDTTLRPETTKPHVRYSIPQARYPSLESGRSRLPIEHLFHSTSARTPTTTTRTTIGKQPKTRLNINHVNDDYVIRKTTSAIRPIKTYKVLTTQDVSTPPTTANYEKPIEFFYVGQDDFVLEPKVETTTLSSTSSSTYQPLVTSIKTPFLTNHHEPSTITTQSTTQGSPVETSTFASSSSVLPDLEPRTNEPDSYGSPLGSVISSFDQPRLVSNPFLRHPETSTILYESVDHTDDIVSSTPKVVFEPSSEGPPIMTAQKESAVETIREVITTSGKNETITFTRDSNIRGGVEQSINLNIQVIVNEDDEKIDRSFETVKSGDQDGLLPIPTQVSTSTFQPSTTTAQAPPFTTKETSTSFSTLFPSSTTTTSFKPLVITTPTTISTMTNTPVTTRVTTPSTTTYTTTPISSPITTSYTTPPPTTITSLPSYSPPTSTVSRTISTPTTTTTTSSTTTTTTTQTMPTVPKIATTYRTIIDPGQVVPHLPKQSNHFITPPPKYSKPRRIQPPPNRTRPRPRFTDYRIKKPSIRFMDDHVSNSPVTESTIYTSNPTLLSNVNPPITSSYGSPLAPLTTSYQSPVSHNHHPSPPSVSGIDIGYAPSVSDNQMPTTSAYADQDYEAPNVVVKGDDYQDLYPNYNYDISDIMQLYTYDDDDVYDIVNEADPSPMKYAKDLILTNYRNNLRHGSQPTSPSRPFIRPKTTPRPPPPTTTRTRTTTTERPPALYKVHGPPYLEEDHTTVEFDYTQDLLPDLGGVVKSFNWNVHDFQDWKKLLEADRESDHSHEEVPYLGNPFQDEKPNLELVDKADRARTTSFDELINTKPMNPLPVALIDRRHDDLRSAKVLTNGHGGRPLVPKFDIGFEDWLEELGVSTEPSIFKTSTIPRRKRLLMSDDSHIVPQVEETNNKARLKLWTHLVEKMKKFKSVDHQEDQTLDAASAMSNLFDSLLTFSKALLAGG